MQSTKMSKVLLVLGLILVIFAGWGLYSSIEFYDETEHSAWSLEALRNPYLAAPSPRVSIWKSGSTVFRTSPAEPWRIVRTEMRIGGSFSGPVEGGGTPAGYFTAMTPRSQPPRQPLWKMRT